MNAKPEKLHIGGVDQEQERCLRCGSWYLDTGWECNDCGYDNMPHYYKPDAAMTPATPTGKAGESISSIHNVNASDEG